MPRKYTNEQIGFARRRRRPAPPSRRSAARRGVAEATSAQPGAVIAHGVQEVGEPTNGDGCRHVARLRVRRAPCAHDRGLGDIVRVQIVFEYPVQVVEAQLVECGAHLIDANPGH